MNYMVHEFTVYEVYLDFFLNFHEQIDDSFAEFVPGASGISGGGHQKCYLNNAGCLFQGFSLLPGNGWDKLRVGFATLPLDGTLSTYSPAASGWLALNPFPFPSVYSGFYYIMAVRLDWGEGFSRTQILT